MNEELKKRCEDFINAREAIRETYKLENVLLLSVCANIFVSKHVSPDKDTLKKCKNIIKDNVGIFSNFRGNMELPIISMLAVSDNPEEKFGKITAIYKKMKEKFTGSEYIALTAAVLSDMISVEDADKYIERGKAIYKRMSKEHPFLTSSEDSVFAVLMAFSEKSDDELIAEMENIYRQMKESFSDGNSVQSLSHVLTLAGGSWKEKCEKVNYIYDELKNNGRKYSKYFELAVLGAAAILPVDGRTLVDDILKVDEFLSGQKRYAGVFGIDKKTRLMHAAMLVSGSYTEVGAVAAVTGTVATIAAQQAAMCCIIAANAAATAAASSST